MSAFRSAPWFLKVLLVVFPLLLLARAFATMQALSFGLRHPNQSASFWSLVAFDLLAVALLAASIYMTWQQRPISRWLISIVFLLIIANSAYQHLVPVAPTITLPRIPADESRAGYQVGAFLAQAMAAWWAYMCVFSRRALIYFNVFETSAHAPAD